MEAAPAVGSEARRALSGPSRVAPRSRRAPACRGREGGREGGRGAGTGQAAAGAVSLSLSFARRPARWRARNGGGSRRVSTGRAWEEPGRGRPRAPRPSLRPERERQLQAPAAAGSRGIGETVRGRRRPTGVGGSASVHCSPRRGARTQGAPGRRKAARSSRRSPGPARATGNRRGPGPSTCRAGGRTSARTTRIGSVPPGPDPGLRKVSSLPARRGEELLPLTVLVTGRSAPGPECSQIGTHISSVRGLSRTWERRGG